MNIKNILTIMSIALLASLSGNGYLLYIKSQYEKTISGINYELASTNKEFSQSQDELAKAKDEIIKLKKTVDEFFREKSNLAAKVSHFMCSPQIASTQVSGLSSNQGLIEPITSAVERYYGAPMINTSFKLAWNNSKTAIFDLLDKEGATVKVITSWDFKDNLLLAVYDINAACLFYFR